MGQEWRNYGQETRPDGKWVRATGQVGVRGLKDRLENFEAFADAAEAASLAGLIFGVDIERARPRPASAYGLKVLGLAQCKGLFGGVKARGWELGYIRQDLAEDLFEHLVANDISIASELSSILYDMTDPAVLFYLIVPKGDTREDRSRRKQAVEAMTKAYEIRSGLRDPSPSRHRSLQYVKCTFAPGGRAYTYHWDGEPVKVGNQVEAVTRDGKKKLTVVGVSEDSPPFATKPILGLAPPKEDAPEPAATNRRVGQKTQGRRVRWEKEIQEREQLIVDTSDLLTREDLNITALWGPERKIARAIEALGWQFSKYRSAGVREGAIAQAEKQKIALRELAQRVEARIVECQHQIALRSRTSTREITPQSQQQTSNPAPSTNLLSPGEQVLVETYKGFEIHRRYNGHYIDERWFAGLKQAKEHIDSIGSEPILDLSPYASATKEAEDT